MIAVSVRNLKTNLTRYLREIESGTQITVTRRGKPVAVISPLVETDEQRLDRKLTELEARGVLRKGIGKPMIPDLGIKLRGEGPTLSEMVIEDRG